MSLVEIDSQSGFCFGVVNAIRKAEDRLDSEGTLYCLGDIVHNSLEVERLRRKGLHTLSHKEMEQLHKAHILFRAHGEPPATYRLASQNGLEIIDATCPVVLNLQKRIRTLYENSRQDGTQLLIFGKQGHSEVNGLVGQTDNTALVIERPEDLAQVDFGRPIAMFSQTTKSQEDYRRLVEAIQERLQPGTSFVYYDTICRHFANRVPNMRRFAAAHDAILFVSDAKSSNGKALLNACLETNSDTHFVSGPDDVQAGWLAGKTHIGVCGATSTPTWLMEQVKARAEQLCENGGR